MDAKQLLVEALRLSAEERAALAGELIQILDREVDVEAEAAWSEEIRVRLERLDAGTATTIPWSEARRRIHAAAGRGPRVVESTQPPVVARELEYLQEALQEAEAAARWYAERSPTAAAAFTDEIDAAETAIVRAGEDVEREDDSNACRHS